MGLTEFLAGHITAFIQSTGYLSVFVLMILESMVFPIPSEAVMPFAGFLIVSGHFTLPLVILVSTFGSIIGSLLSYAIGLYGGKPFLAVYGKFFLLQPKELEATERFFNKRGSITILICRFIPIIRHLISIPAGFAKMNIWLFSLYTIIGAGLWNTILAVCGIFLKENWNTLMKYSHIVDYFVVAGLGLLLAYFLYTHLKNNIK